MNDEGEYDSGDGVAATATLEIIRAADELRIALAGRWCLDTARPDLDSVIAQLQTAPPPAVIRFDASRLGEWDSGLLTRLVAIHRAAATAGVAFDEGGLPKGVGRLLALARAVKVREDARRTSTTLGFLERIGEATLTVWQQTHTLLKFIGEVWLSVRRFARGRARYLKADLVQHVQQAGVEAYAIVSLISFLIGMIFAFVGVMQLRPFGAGIYTANLVAVAMVREMAPIMTAIIMAGRTGAAYAAEIGTMKVNEEIDALSTLGIDPIDFLVTPRMLALVLMIPLLTMYASFMGILGGMGVGLVMLDVGMVQYVQQTIDAVGFNSLFGGLFKSVVYGALVALAGCQQGMACGGSAMAVGQATTRAVVMGIVLIVISASILTVIYINLGI
jgi:phospholipid/cholesterol/gamma-HCH transport system permease protein